MNASDQTVKTYFYASVLIVPIGLIFNLIQFHVFGSSKFNKINMGFLMRVLAVSDSIALFWNFIIYKYLPVIGINISTYSSISCVLVSYLARVFQLIPLLIQAFLSLINYLSVTNQAKLIHLSKKSNLILSISIIILFCVLIHSPNAIKYLNWTNSNNQTVLVCTYSSSTIALASTLITAFVRFILPFLLINITNIFTVRALIRPRQVLNISTENERKFAKTLVYLGFIFFLFNFPISFIEIIEVINRYSLNKVINFTSYLIEDISYVIAWSYYGIGFFVSFSFNKVFRKVLENKLKILLCRANLRIKHSIENKENN